MRILAFLALSAALGGGSIAQPITATVNADGSFQVQSAQSFSAPRFPQVEYKMADRDPFLVSTLVGADTLFQTRAPQQRQDFGYSAQEFFALLAAAVKEQCVISGVSVISGAEETAGMTMNGAAFKVRDQFPVRVTPANPEAFLKVAQQYQIPVRAISVPGANKEGASKDAKALNGALYLFVEVAEITPQGANITLPKYNTPLAFVSYEKNFTPSPSKPRK